MMLIEFSMYPLGQGESVSRFVARSLDIIDKSGLDYRLHPLGTTLEGEYDQVMEVVKQCFDAMAKDCDRIACNMRFDYRKGRQGRLAANIERVEGVLGRSVKQ